MVQTPEEDLEKVPGGTSSDGQANDSDSVAKEEESNILTDPPSHDEHPSSVRSSCPFTTPDHRWPEVPINPFQALPGSTVDPHSTQFIARDWVQSLVKFKASEPRSASWTAPLAFRNLHVYGHGPANRVQTVFGCVVFDALRRQLGSSPPQIHILKGLEGFVDRGEMLLVLGPPGAGCTTFLKTITRDHNDLSVASASYIDYRGRESVFTAEADTHFPMLTVGDTLYFAARARAARHLPGHLDAHTWAIHLRDAVMAMLGISHTMNTRVGSDFIRGCSGGERKRVSLAEALLTVTPFGSASLHAWDNSTRGLDSANAIEFCRAVRLATEIGESTAAVSMYQAPEDAYNLFDKVLLLYEGQQIYFGSTATAKEYFEKLGFQCPERQTTADFLTSMASPQQRSVIVRPGWESRVPRTAEEFATIWKASSQREPVALSIDRLRTSRPASNPTHPGYQLGLRRQIQLCLWRGIQRARGDPSVQVVQIVGNTIMAIILGTVFLNLAPTAETFFQRSAVLFFGVLVNAFASTLEMLTLFAQRPVVEKQTRVYSLYRAASEACASMIVDLPWKIGTAIIFNTTLYFMVGLRREAGAYFFFLLVNFLLTLTMSMLFRTIASASPSLPQAMAPAGIVVTGLVIFTGFAIPLNYQPDWCRWISYIDPIAYGYEALMINEFQGRNFSCSFFVPGYGSFKDNTAICASAVGAKPGQDFVSGSDYIYSNYAYTSDHRWRNVGIIIAFMLFLLGTHLAAIEYVRSRKRKLEVLTFARNCKLPFGNKMIDEESSESDVSIPTASTLQHAAVERLRQPAVNLTWKHVCYDITVQGQPRRLLDNVDGWIKPGTLTALMGASGTGKTTLLNVLATRANVGYVSGDILINGCLRGPSFPRKTGYAQQQDFHLHTSSVREALQFSALLRQPSHVPRAEKLAYANYIVDLLEMTEYADAIVGMAGDGLNIEQRKRLTIGVELVAKPELLFLDEPTSGLDSATSWAILDLLEKLKHAGQAVLCTIHQPSALLFQRFDRLLLLRSGGQTVYFGDIGDQGSNLVEYLERNDINHRFARGSNPAEWMLQVIGAAPGSDTDIDWFQVWRNSSEYKKVQTELDRMQNTQLQKGLNTWQSKDNNSFAAPLTVQIYEVTRRVFAQYWRTPSYIYSKGGLSIGISLFIGLIFLNAPLTHQGLINQEFALFMLSTVFAELIQQTMPQFVAQRTLFEIRERPSNTYSWKAFMFANIFVELPWNALMSVFMFIVFYYPLGLYRNAGDEVAIRGFQFFLFVLQFMLYTSTLCNMVISAVPSSEIGGNIANLIFILSLVFCGVLQPPSTLPRFWIFMYRVTPLTYLVSGMLSNAIGDASTYCATNEFLHFNAPTGQDCGTYMESFTRAVGGYLANPTATQDCQYCLYDEANEYLRTISVSYADSWRNFGIIWVYIIFNIAVAVFTYWLARVPRQSRTGRQGAIYTSLFDNVYFQKFGEVWALFWHD